MWVRLGIDDPRPRQLLAGTGSSLSCNHTLAAIQTRSYETVQERLGILKDQSLNALGVLPYIGRGGRAWRSGAASTAGYG